MRPRVLSILVLAVACGGQSEKGGSGGSGGSGGTGGSGAGGTGGVPGCAEIETKYAAYLTQAKGCNALINAIQCTELVDTELSCPCTTYVNPANTAPLQELKTLAAQWATNGCHVGIACPEIACAVPQGAGCQVNGAGGDGDGCVDYGPD